MTLFWIIVAVLIATWLIGFRINKKREISQWRREESNTAVVMISIAVAFCTLLVVNVIGIAVISTAKDVTYSQKLVSIKDGTGIEGSVYGGFFVMRGQINDTQNFSYYRVNDNGSFSLDKRAAPQSTIWQDATPETARVDVTDRVYGCEPTWWAVLCQNQANEFVHADFHVPGESIKNDFTLDAQ
jgi:heme/copper-type cytochrome/quinol oxidase subunit 2